MGKTLNNYYKWRMKENVREYNFHFQKYMRLITNIFRWENLPDRISERFIEENLFREGQLIFFETLDGFVVTRCSGFGFNIYDEPTKYKPITNNPEINSRILNAEDCVPIWNNNFRESSTSDVHYFSKKLSELDKTIFVNLEQMKKPYLVQAPEGQESTVRQIFKYKEDGVPYIITDKNIKKDVSIDTKIFDLHTQNFASELLEMQRSIDGDALTYFGINNINILKKERLITGEADGNNQQIAINLESMYKARRKAVNEINNKYGLDIKLEICENIVNEFNGGENNE